MSFKYEVWFMGDLPSDKRIQRQPHILTSNHGVLPRKGDIIDFFGEQFKVKRVVLPVYDALVEGEKLATVVVK